ASDPRSGIAAVRRDQDIPANARPARAADDRGAAAEAAGHTVDLAEEVDRAARRLDVEIAARAGAAGRAEAAAAGRYQADIGVEVDIAVRRDHVDLAALAAADGEARARGNVAACAARRPRKDAGNHDIA